MIKNLTPSQLLLVAIATIMLLLAAFSFYLLQDPSAPLPFAPAPGTSSPTPISLVMTTTTAPATLTPTRQTSYTPLAAFITPKVITQSEVPVMTEIPTAAKTTSPRATTNEPTAVPTNTHAFTPTSPSASATLSPGEVGVTGRIVQNGTPVANVVVEFADDVAPRQATTNSSGHYWFITLAPGANFTLTFTQSDNLKLTPTSEVASLAWVEGPLPTGVNVVDLPDFEVSINLNGIIFNLQTPADGTFYSASAISASNPIQYNWSLYSQGGTYMVQLGPNGSDTPIWSSSQLALPTFMWNGTLDDGTHITQGTYWWRVSVTKSLGNYILVVFTQQFTIKFTP